MFKIVKYLGEAKAAVLAIILLLIVQAYCDLSLPSYTSDIVDVGIEQGGIENIAPQVMRQETYENISLFMEEEDMPLMEQSYMLNDAGNYERNTSDKEVVETLDKTMQIPIVMVSMLSQGQMVEGKEGTIDSIREMADAGVLDKEALLAMKNQAMEAYGEEMSDMMTEQMALVFIKGEYEAAGLDLQAMQTRYLLTTGGKMLLMTIIMMVAAIGVGFLASQTSAGIGMRLRNRVFRKVVSFSHAEMDQFSAASLITRSTNDIQQVQMVSVMLLRMVCYAPILGIGGIIKVSTTRTGMGWIIVAAVIMIMLLVGTLVMVAMPKFKQMQKLVDRMNLVSREILTGIPVIRAFSRERFEEERFGKANQDLMKTQLFTNRVMTFMMPAMMLIMNIITIMIVWFGAKGIDMGNMQVGDMMAFITYAMQIVMSFLMITMISIMLPRAGVAADRIDEVLHTEPSIVDAEVTRDAEVAGIGEIAFEQVDFQFPGADENAISKVSFTAKPGQTTAIIGSTGCGKSTLLHLILRFYDVTKGRITIDGIDIREISQKKLHSMIGFVPQKGILFSGTIASNLKFAEEEITDEQMKEAAQIAQATEFIEEKQGTYDSPIAQGGTNVSGGQKQRLSIARAIARRPKIFLFDDSFSALDYKTDTALRRALNEKIADATVIIVAQRISTILHADQIIVLDEGRIMGIGTHEELLQCCEAYQEIAKSQLSEAELKGGKQA